MSQQIHICSLSQVENTLIQTSATHLISLLNDEIMIDTPDLITAQNHLKLTMSDINEPMDGRITPEREHIEQLISFVKNWDQTTPIVIHCLAGISRSTAATFITLCTLNPGEPEKRIAQALRDASPTAQPNQLLIAHGDSLLKRNGNMIDAIEDLGLGIIKAEGKPFSLSAKFASR